MDGQLPHADDNNCTECHTRNDKQRHLWCCCFRSGAVTSIRSTKKSSSATNAEDFALTCSSSYTGGLMDTILSAKPAHLDSWEISKFGREYLLPPQSCLYFGRNSLVIDLDETLVHSTFEAVPSADFTVPVRTEDEELHEIFVTKRPFVDIFLRRMAHLFECILFTASLQKYADLVADRLNTSNVFQLRLFRDACVFRDGIYIKDLSLLGRSLSKLAILDNSPACYSLHPHNAISVNSWFNDPNDTELLDLLPYMEKIAAASDIRLLISC